MARAPVHQHTFARGEIGPRVSGRQDTELYFAALEIARNHVVDGRGVLEKRPGTRIAGRTKNDGFAWLIPFVYDETQSYMLEFGEQYFRAWYDGGQVLDGGGPTETATSYAEEDVEALSFCQDQDVMWLAHSGYPWAKVTRTSVSTFSIDDFDTVDGPYLPTNSDPGSKLYIEATGVSPNVGRVSFSDSDPMTPNDIPADLIVGSVMKIWDGSTLQTLTVQSVDRTNNLCETDWTGAPITSTLQWSYDGKEEASGLVAVSVDGVSGVTTGKLKGSGGYTPFDAGRDVGRWVRLLEEDQNASSSDPLEERFQWHSVKIVSVINAGEATIEWSGGNVPATTDFRFGAIYVGQYPRVCCFHEGRLCIAIRNTVYMSAPFDYSNFAPSDVDSSVNPDNAITVTIPAVNSKKGVTSDINFMQSIGSQLVIGTPAGMHTIQSSTLGEGITPDNAVRRPQDSAGAALIDPVFVGDSILFAHKSRRKLMGTFPRDTLDKIGAQQLSLPSDHLLTSGIRGVTWQEEPYSIAWLWMNDGTVAGFTLLPEEKVQAWHSHRIGGYFLENNKRTHARVESMAVAPTSQGDDDSLHMVVKRTVNGSTRRFVEIMRPFRQLGEDLRDAWFLDGALKYEGNEDPAKTITFTGSGVSDLSATTNFASPAMVDGESLAFHDGYRWHVGTVHDTDGSNDFAFVPFKPNAPPGPPDGRWHYLHPDETPEEVLQQFLDRGGAVDPDGSWVQIDTDGMIDIWAATYVEPANVTGIVKWSQAVTAISGLGDYEGENLSVYIDGMPSGMWTVDAGGISGLPAGHVILAGWPYYCQADLLRIEGGSQNGSSQGKQRQTYETGIDVLETLGLWCGTGQPSSYDWAWENYAPVSFPDTGITVPGEPPPTFTGIVRASMDESGPPDRPYISLRQSDPWPCIIRGIIPRISESDGR